jgi:hypothetical protein
MYYGMALTARVKQNPNIENTVRHPRVPCQLGFVSHSVADPHHVDADPDPTYHFDADPDPDFYLMRIRMRIRILSFN